MAHSPQEWLTQADYDFQTAQAMLSSGHYIYAVFMAHLAVEKALKGIYHKKFDALPPKTHSLVYFVNKTKVIPPEHIGKFLVKLDQASVATRYPEDLKKLQRVYTQDMAKEILTQAKETIEWVKKTF